MFVFGKGKSLQCSAIIMTALFQLVFGSVFSQQCHQIKIVVSEQKIEFKVTPGFCPVAEYNFLLLYVTLYIICYVLPIPLPHLLSLIFYIILFSVIYVYYVTLRYVINSCQTHWLKWLWFAIKIGSNKTLI